MTPAILTTKLFVPPPPPNVVGRPRLIARLSESLDRTMALVSAPAGFGKTTLVSGWLAECDRPAAWLSLDERDADPTRFLSYLVAALEPIAPNVGNVSGALRSTRSPPSEAILTGLLNEISMVPEPFTLVLDDYHVVDSHAVDRALAFLLEHGPPQMHVVIATREDPRLPLARTRALGQLIEIRAADLRFDATEVAAFLEGAMDLELSAQDVAALETRTEGWIAGLQLAAISMKGHVDSAGFIASFTGSHRFVLDYLVEEVLQQQPDWMQAFLLRTSILERMCGPLCDAVLQDPAVSGDETLQAIEQANLFVVPLDHERRWYRYHTLFRDLLRQRLHQYLRSPAGADVGGETALDARASQWFEEAGMTVEAFQHAAAAGDVDRAERLIEADGVPLDFRGAAAPVLQWLASLPHATLDARPSLWVTYASAALFGGRSTGVEEKLRAAEAALPGSGTDAENRDLVGRIASLRATLAVMQNDAGAIIAQSQRALQHLAPDNLPVRTAATWALGHAHQLLGDRAAAGGAFADVMRLGASDGESIYTLAAAITSGHLQLSENHLSGATRTYERALQLAGDPPHPMAAEAHLGLGRICYHRNDLGVAEQHGQQCARLLPLMEKVATVASHRILRSRLRLAHGDHGGASAELDEAAAYVHEHGFEFQMPEIAAAKVLTSLWQGAVATAARLADTHDLPLGRARVLLAQGDPAMALAVLEPVRREADENERADARLEVTVLQAVAHLACGHEPEAGSALEEALALGEPEGFIRIFIDEGAPMAQLLSGAVARGVMPAYVAELSAALAVAEREQRRPVVPDAGAMREPLSERELEVLRLMAQGLSNREIGERLFRALDTVKGHGRRIFAKLEAKNRTEAVARARELGLL